MSARIVFAAKTNAQINRLLVKRYIPLARINAQECCTGFWRDFKAVKFLQAVDLDVERNNVLLMCASSRGAFW
jgi:hypothetical protein